MATCPSVQNASQVKLSAAFQTDFDTPNYAGLQEMSSRNANPSPGNVQFETSGAVGEVAPVDVAPVMTTVEKSLNFNNMPKQLNTLAKWALGAPLSETPAPQRMVSIGYRGFAYARMTAAADSITFETSSDGTAWVKAFTVALPATIAEVMAAVNAEDGWFANPVYGGTAAQWAFEGTLSLEAVSLVPASPLTGTTATLRMYSPLSNSPEYLTILYKLFANTAGAQSYTADVGAQATAFNVAMPKGGYSTIEMPYIAKQNIEVDAALITQDPLPMDKTGQYRSNPGLYRIYLAGKYFKEITEVSAQLALSNNPEKSWDTTQIATGITKFDLQAQLTGLLAWEYYSMLLGTYRAADESKSYLPTLIAVTHPQYADPAKAVPYMFGYIVPKAKISQSPDLNVEEGQLVPCNVALQAVMPKNPNEKAFYFFVIS